MSDYYWVKSLCPLEVRNKTSREAFTWFRVISAIFPSRDKNSGSMQFRLVTFGEVSHMRNCGEALRAVMVGWWSSVKIVTCLDTRHNSEGRHNSVWWWVDRNLEDVAKARDATSKVFHRICFENCQARSVSKNCCLDKLSGKGNALYQIAPCGPSSLLWVRLCVQSVCPPQRILSQTDRPQQKPGRFVSHKVEMPAPGSPCCWSVFFLPWLSQWLLQSNLS